MPRRMKNPDKAPVQLNIQVPFDFRAHLFKTADKKRVSLTSLVRQALQDAYPPPKGVEAFPDGRRSADHDPHEGETPEQRTERLRKFHKGGPIPGSWS